MRDSPAMASRLRVIAGEAKGLRLVAPPDARPTTDRVREALFSALGDRLTAVAVLDLYAGSGALGIEALSRGAAAAVLVDRDRRAVEACEENLATTRLADRARVVVRDVEVFLRQPPPPEAPFAVVFADPPYERTDAEVGEALSRLQAPGWLSPGASVVLERPSGAEAPKNGWQTGWERKYGDTLVTIVHVSD